ncbi:hypothetical protein B0T25DRAFT_267678 [Lasiosphaeria hispida]|uniref:Uncharacterized protein n=1 Tax=Lasiosphaeria hispida TaxID=260671 RepID=A0AAJ0MA99_9PEZI|nr:hypothetical protein B0T25DRAFT_267678 [Lasiosphaeria hispida]
MMIYRLSVQSYFLLRLGQLLPVVVALRLWTKAVLDDSTHLYSAITSYPNLLLQCFRRFQPPKNSPLSLSRPFVPKLASLNSFYPLRLLRVPTLYHP